jgi:sialate O-acetylesterase
VLGTEFESPKGQTFFRNKPTGLFNGMVSPLMNYAVKGVIWYQGESDTGNTAPYGEKMKTLISGWRELWKQGD